MANREKVALGAAVRARREELGLLQRDLAEIVNAGGLAWTQQTVAKSEAGKRDLTLIELALVSLALQTTPTDLLDYAPVEPLEVGKGFVMPVATLQTLLDGSVPDLDALTDDDGLGVRAVITTSDVLAGDPDYAALGRMTGFPPVVLAYGFQTAAAEYARDLGSRRRRWTARDLVSALLERWKTEHPDANAASIRKARDHTLRELRDTIREIVAVSGPELGIDPAEHRKMLRESAERMER